MNLVVLEVGGIQGFIFATNRLAENVGASQLAYAAGAFEPVLAASGKRFDDSPALREWLLAQPPLERSDAEAEVVVATSGTATLLVRDERVGRRIVRQVTSAALRDAPGLSVFGALSEPFDDLAAIDAHAVLAGARRRMEELRHRIPSPAARFPRAPFLAPCATHEYPAARWDGGEPSLRDDDGTPLPGARGLRSRVADRKRRASREGRLHALARAHDLRLFENLHRLERAVDDDLRWLGVVHADGNGFGTIFERFDRHADARGPGQARRYLDTLRRFSCALEEATESAFVEAARGVRPVVRRRTEWWPLVPLVLGGDDVTVLCDGGQAVDFARDYLLAFEERTASGVLADVAERGAGGARRLAACAGVAVVKPRFPFHAAHGLAEDLTKSAKQVKRKVEEPCCALDFHVLYDTAHADLERLRGELAVDDSRLTARPYVLAGEDRRNDWSAPRTWELLAKDVATLLAPDERDPGRRAIPNSLLHEIRERLFDGPDDADARAALARTDVPAFAGLLTGASLYWNDTDGARVTRFLDALELTGIRGGTRR